MTTATFYIGADNQTDVSNYERVLNLLHKEKVQGGTMFEGLGFWQGKTEPSTVVQIMNTEGDDIQFMNDMIDLAKRMKVELSQDCIMITFSADTVIFA